MNSTQPDEDHGVAQFTREEKLPNLVQVVLTYHLYKYKGYFLTDIHEQIRYSF